MRTLSKTAWMLAASLMLTPAGLVGAQAPEAGSGTPGMQGGQRGGRGGFGRMGQPVQGTATGVSSGKITIKTEAGDTYEVTPAENARVMKDRQAIQLSDIKPGDMVTAMGQVDATKKTVIAMMLMDVDAATAAKAKENLGKTYIVGRITAIDADNLKLTVERQDKVAQVVAVDEGTSFQRGMRGVAQEIQVAGGMAGGFGGGSGGGRGMGGGGMRRQDGQGGAQPGPESITLADIKVGDTVAATGSVRNGTFTAAKMGVTEPGAGPRGGRGMGAGQGDGAGAPATPPPQ
ncbi:MAG TPA: hypothetical protein VHU44_06210 [Acidobacteriaceae bacterium]|jgi:hypothetical protein|nr:hypothetical protein [Acidobacteriaceae bacterium]